MRQLAIVLIIFAFGFGAGWKWNGARADARVSTLKSDHEEASRKAAEAAAVKLKAAADRADRIDQARAEAEAALTKQISETQHAIKNATRNRPCLGGPALRVLEQSPGLRLAPAQPAPASPLPGGSAAATPDPADEEEYATDTEIAGWIATAGVLYERCRSRLDDIGAWEEGERQ